MSKQMNHRVSDELHALVGELEKLNGTNTTETILDLVADGMRFRMLHESPVPLVEIRVTAMKSEAMSREFSNFLEAIRDQCGVLNADDSQPRYRFQQYPDTEYWRARKIAGLWAVIPKLMTIGPDSITQTVA